MHIVYWVNILASRSNALTDCMPAAAAQDQIPRKLHQKWFVPTEFPGRCVIWLTWSDDTFQTVAEKTKTFLSRSFQSEEIWVIADCQICQTAWRLTRKGWQLGNPCYIEYEIATIEGIWYSWYMTFSMIIGFFLAPRRLQDNLKSQIQIHLNILNYCLTITCYGLTIRCYGVTSGKCFRPLRWNFGAFADTHMFDSWWRGHFWERGRMQRERGQ